jgi:hypothetical protein
MKFGQLHCVTLQNSNLCKFQDIAEIAHVADTMHTAREYVGDLLQVLTRRTQWDTYLSVCTAGYWLFIWFGVASPVPSRQ